MIEIGRIEIITYLDIEGEEIDAFKAVTPEGQKLPLKQILGSLTLAIDSAKRYVLWEDEDEEPGTDV